MDKLSLRYYGNKKLHYHPAGSRIIQHYQHAYNEHGQVIVVEGPKEDRQEYVDSFAETCGLKNLLNQLLKQGMTPEEIDEQLAFDPMAEDNGSADLSGMPRSINEMAQVAQSSSSEAAQRLVEFNKLLGTDYSMEQFVKMVNDGSIASAIKEKLSVDQKGENE